MRISADSVALTPMQSWMFYESIPAHRPWVNLEQAVVYLEDEQVSGEALRKAWADVAALHPALRAFIRWRDLPKPHQAVADGVCVDFEELNWTDSAPGAQDTALQTFLTDDQQRGIEIETSPPWRVTLIHLGETRSVMVWTVHNALIDGTSVAIVLEDVFSALDSGRPVSQPQAAKSYLDMCEIIGAPADPAAETYFATYLDGFEPLGLTANSVEAKSERRAEFLTHVIDADVTAALLDTAERCGGTRRNLVQAAWGLLLARWHNSEDVVFGVTGGGRNLFPDARRATGCFLNTLPRRMKVTRNSTLSDIIQAQRIDAEDMKPFEQVSAAEIRRFCNLHSASYLFDTVIMFNRGSLKDLFRRAQLRSEKRRAELHSEIDLPMSLGVYTNAATRLELEVDPAVVPKDRAARMLDQLSRLLVSMSAATPETMLRDLDMLGNAARGELLALGEPEQTTDYVDFLSRFRKVVALDPEAIAVQSAGQPASLSYGALDSESDRLAALLQSKGAGPGEIVAIHLGRSPDYFVSLLAVLKTGAAFLPVDPSYPTAVIDYMLRDSRARLVISTEMEAPASGAEVVPPDAEADGGTLRAVVRDPGGPAYVIYTSGSTGKPKGVVIPDRAMVGHTLAASRQLGITAEDRIYQFMSLSFDFSLEEILPTLFNGATLILRSDSAAGSAPDLLAEISTLSLTVLNLPTAYFNIVTDYLKASGGTAPDRLRLVNFGGERANPEIVKDWLRLVPNVPLLNGYGPTETAVSCTFYQPEGELPEGDIPIGTVTDHAICYVVAPDGSLTPPGAIGELWVGGVAVGLGYLGLPERTAQVFLSDHFRGNGTVYRTGDRVSWRADGNLDFFGRTDRQVKMRGFRIDLGHVEQVLEKSQPNLRVFAGVRDANTPGARVLAWVMNPEKGSSVDVDALQTIAEQELPPAMRPRIVEVDEFPRTAGGKVNLAALPDPGQPSAPVARDVPMNELEMQIAEQIAQVLLVPNVGAKDDFYDLGGHSLLAAELVGRIEVNLGHRISVIDLQKHPTARGLASVLSRGSTGPRNIVAIQPNGSKPPLFGVHILGGMDSYYTALAEELGADQPLLGVTVGVLARDKPFGVEETARRYFEEIQKFHPDGPIHLAAVSLGAYFAWELARLFREAGREIGLFALFDADGPGGRDSHTGLNRIAANIRTVQHRGYGAIPEAIYNRFQEFRYAQIAKRLKRQEASGTGVEIRDGNDFIASNDLAVGSYEPKPLAVPFTIYRSAQNFFDTEACIKSGLGWEKVALKGYEVVDVPGGHLTMLDPPHVKVLARHMARVLANG